MELFLGDNAQQRNAVASQPVSKELRERWVECDRIRGFSRWVVFCYHATHHSALLEAACAWCNRRALQHTLKAWRQWASSQLACAMLSFSSEAWTPPRDTNAEINRTLLDVSERRQAAMRLLGGYDALHA